MVGSGQFSRQEQGSYLGCLGSAHAFHGVLQPLVAQPKSAIIDTTLFHISVSTRPMNHIDAFLSSG